MRTIGLVLFLISLTSCSTTEPPDNPEPVLKLELEDVSCTEAWITLTTNNLQLPANIYLLKDNNITKTINLQTADTLLYIDSLLPNQTFNLQVSSIQYQVSSNELSVTTLDTTSHNFTWQTWTFGEHSSSTLYDVAIVNENCIWAVGEIYMYDSLGNSVSYNAVHWNGSEWVLERILYKGGFWVIRTIYAFSENDIWFSTSVRYLNGQFIELPIPDVLIGWAKNKLWGSSSSDLYAVGNAGNIAHWNGSKWTKIESGTDLNINDIWGDYNEKTGDWEILAVASNVNSSTERRILKIDNNSSQLISTTPIQWSLRSVWFNTEKKYYVVGSGVYEKNNLSLENWQNEPSDITTFYVNRIRGNNINDVLGVGAFGDVIHFNGYNWKVDYTEHNLSFGTYLSIAFEQDIFVAVGLEYNQAVILTGKRNNK